MDAPKPVDSHHFALIPTLCHGIIYTMTTKPATQYYTLRKGPVPDLSGRIKYPFRTMKVGYFFDVPRTRDHAMRVRASEQKKKYGRLYIVRRMKKDPENGIPEDCTRVHRIA